MEEKKTKKMTKAAAFEYLKGKKVKCYDGTNILYCKLVDEMEKCGCTYKGFMCPPNVSVWAIWVDVTGKIHHCLTIDADSYNYLFCREISADDILSIGIVEEEDTSMPTVEFERYVKILQAWSKRLNSSFVFSERGMGIIRGDLLTKLEGEEMGGYYKVEATL